MVKKTIIQYKNSFSGLRKEVWWLALITLINRAGTMVIPFLSLYLRADLGFSLEKIGWVMSAFGLGSVIGAWLGGKLSDKLGFYPVIFWSLLISGILFIALQYIHSFAWFCVGILVLMIVSDSFRPAAYVAINTYSSPKNRTRSVTLIRLAINLGFSIGPAAGGLIVAFIGYKGLFWADGITCIAAGLVFIALLNRSKAKSDALHDRKVTNRSPYRDKPYLLFLFIVTLIGFSFLQYFSTVPLYYSEVHHLSEERIGLLLAMNGLLIFLIEMPLMKYFERKDISIYAFLGFSTLLIALSFILLNLFGWIGILWIGMVFMTFGEMLNFPFLNRYALDRAEQGKSGEYMALFTMAFSMAHIFGHNIGMHLIDRFGYEVTWNTMSGILICAACLLIPLKIISNKRK